MTKKGTGVRQSSTRGGNDAGNHDDTEGYYKANIGEVVSFPRYEDDDDGDDTTNERRRNKARQQQQQQQQQHSTTTTDINFKVLGIVGKGVFSTVLKCVRLREESLEQQQQQVVVSETDVVAMKLIRNNETMAKAAQKEVRILRLLCYSAQSSSKAVTKLKVDDNDDGNSNSENNTNEEEEGKESSSSSSKKKEIRERLRNHNIVRLLELERDFCDDDANNNNQLSYQQHQQRPSQRPLLEYRSHTTLLFEHLPFNLRETLAKFGKNVGINLSAVKSYRRQLLVALNHLATHRIVHADIKPDNILVSADFSTVKLCDFGSAFFETETEIDGCGAAPYLVSRFYRAPEVILGLEYDRMVDLWSVAVTLAELFTGEVLFPGRSNNDQLRMFMETIGPFSNRMVRRHVVSYSSRLGLTPHFEAERCGGNYNFRSRDFDKVTGLPIVKVVVMSGSGVGVASKQIPQIMLRARSVKDERGEVLKFADFLGKCLTLDPGRRVSLKEAMTLVG